MAEKPYIPEDDDELPYSLEAEQSILGALLICPDQIGDVIEKLKVEAFFVPRHRTLFEIMLQEYALGKPFDFVTILDVAMQKNVFESRQAGLNYLYTLTNLCPNAENITSYCDIVMEKYTIRRLTMTARGILQDIQNGNTTAETLLESAEQQIWEIRQGKDTRDMVKIGDAVFEAYDRLGKISGPEKEKYLGARSGFQNLDRVISGLNNSDLIIIAARPGMGKTSFAMNIATHVARNTEKDVAVFSLEMSAEQIATRLLSTEALVDSNQLRSGQIHQDEWVRLAESAEFISNFPIYIDETSITVSQMKAKLQRMKNLGLVVIDYIQLMSASGNIRSDNRVQIVSEITRQMKLMAKELDVPILALSQLSRALESRTDKRPQLSDLRESGSIEQDADIVLFLYREGYYDRETKTPNLAECIVAKNRHGETGSIPLIWDGQYTRFSSAETGEA